MNSGIWRLAGSVLLSLAISGQAAVAASFGGADIQGGPSQGGQSQHQGQGAQGRPGGHGGDSGGGKFGSQDVHGNSGGGWQGRPPGNNGGQWQGRPPGGNDGQWHGGSPGNNGGQWQGRPPGGGSGNQWQGNNGGQGQNRPPADRDDHGKFGSHEIQRPPPGGWQGRPPANHGNWGPHPSYWRPGYVVNTVPPGHYRVPYRGADYFFNDGYWYRPYGSRYVVVAPPYGVRVRYLPSYAEQVWIGSVGYFLVAGTYYLWQAGSQDYEVVAPPVAQPAMAQAGYDVVAYPIYGQGPDQQSRDRYECHRWAAEQSGFDPASASYAPPADVADNYRRALGACLSGRGYSIN